jgi:hypothetical protein
MARGLCAEEESSGQEVSATSAFIRAVSCPLPLPLLRALPRNTAPTRRRTRRPATTVRNSLRIAAKDWPKGDTQAKARQVLMKKLGIPEDEEHSADDRFLHYFSLFQAPSPTRPLRR